LEARLAVVLQSMAVLLPQEHLRGPEPRGDEAPGLPAGPRLPRLAQTAGWLFWPIRFLESCRRRYGGRFTMLLGLDSRSPPLVALSDPAHVKEVFTGDPEVFHAGEANAILKPILGASSLLLLDGPRHRDERKLMMPAFHGERMQAYGQIMRERTDRAIDGWPLGEVFPLHTQMQDITLDVILRTVFGLEEGPRHADVRRALIRMLSFGDHPSLMLLIGRDGEVRGRAWHERAGRYSPWASFQRTIEAVDQQLLGEIQRRRAGGDADRQDVLSLLLAARDEEGHGLADRELVDEMKTLLVAGHETTATALTWTVLELIRHPQVLQRLVAELATGDEYLDAVIKESLRLHPIVPMVGRLLQAPAEVGGHAYPSGVVLAPNIYLVHTNPAVWPDPHRFDPERFLGAKISPYEYLPFGGGVRRCIGMAFALFEMRTVLRQIASRVRLELPRGYQPRLIRRGITFAVSKGLPVAVAERRPASAS
jgi:cytochrome P450